LEERHLMKREKEGIIMMLHTKRKRTREGILAFSILKRSPLSLLTSNDDERGVGCLGSDVLEGRN